MNTIVPKMLNENNFLSFGKIIEKTGECSIINDGRTKRFDNSASVEVIAARVELARKTGEFVEKEIVKDAQNAPPNAPLPSASISIFEGQPSKLPIGIKMMERHPLGSQAFMPLNNRPWLVVVADDNNGKPGKPQAFCALGNQGVNYNRNVWHYPLLCLGSASDFLVVDRVGPNNLDTYNYSIPYVIKKLPTYIAAITA